MAGFSSLLEMLVGCSVDVVGNGALHGGKGLLLAGARRIGWANSGSAGRQGRRFAGHSIARRRIGSGVGGAAGPLGNYDPRQEYASRTRDQYTQASRSGSGVIRFNVDACNGPPKLHGRPCAEAPGSVLGRSGGKWIKSGPAPVQNMNRPRNNIRY